MRSLSVVISSMVIFVSCVSPGSFTTNHYDANPNNITNEKLVNTSPDIVWDNLVKEISKSYFMINNIDKESRIINISFSSNNVSEYVDCGRVQIRVNKSSLNKIGLEQYDYKICERKTYIVEMGAPNHAGIMAPIICEVTRKPSLEGRMNIYVAPHNDGTLVTINCRYIINIDLSDNCEYFAPAGKLVNRQQHRDSYSCSIDSKRPSPCEPLKGDSFICYPTGNLEKEILSFIR